jgi:AmiR/NasT family two-component response regulator
VADRDEIAKLQREARTAEAHIAELDARALVRDEKILDLMKEVDNLNAAMESRAVIEQAKGTIMAATGCSPDAAFAVLVARSNSENRRVRDIAEEIMELAREAGA